jgi:uncharacterized Zn finger protein (UPF0148 family)
MIQTHCYMCSKQVTPLVVGEIGNEEIFCPKCFSDLSDKNDPVLSKEARKESIRNSQNPVADLELREAKSKKGGQGANEADLDLILQTAFEDLGLSEAGAKMAAKGR